MPHWARPGEVKGRCDSINFRVLVEEALPSAAVV